MKTKASFISISKTMTCNHFSLLRIIKGSPCNPEYAYVSRGLELKPLKETDPFIKLCSQNEIVTKDN